MKRVIWIALFWAATLCAQTASTPPGGPGEPWKPLRFLIGTWEARARGGSAGASSTGTYSFQLELKNQILSRHSFSAECKGPKDFNCEHSDLLYIYPAAPGGPLKGIFFDNEGHVIHYDVSVPGPASLVLLSESSQKGPQYRLSYELKGQELAGKFEIRMPGQSDFRAYLEWAGPKK